MVQASKDYYYWQRILVVATYENSEYYYSLKEDCISLYFILMHGLTRLFSMDFTMKRLIDFVFELLQNGKKTIWSVIFVDGEGRKMIREGEDGKT